MTQVSSTGGVPRHASGVVRSISLWTAFVLGLHCISLSSSGLIPFSWVASVWPGADIKTVLTVAMALCALHASAYAIIGTIFPVEGADYFFASRVVPPIIGFTASWTLVLFSAFVVGGLAAWVPTTVLPSLLRPIGIIMDNPRFLDLSDQISSPWGVFVVGAVIIALGAMTTTRTSGLLRTFLTVGFALGVSAWVIIFWSLWSAYIRPELFREQWDHFMGALPYGSFDKRVELARNAGMVIRESSWSGLAGGLIMGFWIFYGYYIPTFFAEEIESPRRTLIFASLGALIFSWSIFWGAAYLLQEVIPLDWIAAEGYLANNSDKVTELVGKPVLAMPWITFYAAILKPNAWLICFVAFAWVFTMINLVQTYFFYCSRIIFSWTQDRVLPDWILGDPLNPSFNRSMIVVSIFAIGGLLDASLGGALGTQLKFAFFAVVTQLVPVFALTFLPVLSPAVFDLVPNSLKRKFFGVPAASIIGGLTFIYLCAMVLFMFLYPAAGVEQPLWTISLLASFILLGMFLFMIMRRYRLRSERIDITRTFKITSPSESPARGA